MKTITKKMTLLDVQAKLQNLYPILNLHYSPDEDQIKMIFSAKGIKPKEVVKVSPQIKGLLKKREYKVIEKDSTQKQS